MKSNRPKPRKVFDSLRVTWVTGKAQKVQTRGLTFTFFKDEEGNLSALAQTNGKFFYCIGYGTLQSVWPKVHDFINTMYKDKL